MSLSDGASRIPPAALEVMIAKSQGDAGKLAALAALLLSQQDAPRAYTLAREARALAPDDPAIASITAPALAAQVQGWHFKIVRDEARNRAWREAIERAVDPATRVLDIGAGTGLLAMMAARAGAGEVIACEMNPVVADMAAEVVAHNGLADRVRIVPKVSTALDPDADLGGPVDLLVSEIVSNDMLAEAVLPAMEDAVARLLRPGGAMIPRSGQAMVALAYWQGLAVHRLGEIDGFDLAPFNAVARLPIHLKAGDPELALRSAAETLFDFDFTSGGPWPGAKAGLALAAEGGPANGVVQWIRLQLDATGTYENRPAPGAESCWAVRFHPLAAEVPAGTPLRVRGAHDRNHIRIWAER